MASRGVVVAPSMLSCDFGCVAAEAQRMLDSGADWLHLDVMDGHFVPNLTFGHGVVHAIREHCPDAFLDCHLMVSHPQKWIDGFQKAGANQFTFHIESDHGGAVELARAVRERGMKCGVSVKPQTPVDDISDLLLEHDVIDTVLVMTVEPGFGGQTFMSDMMPKITTLRNQMEWTKYICVDGGVNPTTAATSRQAGADALVAGTAVFRASDASEAIAAIRGSA